MQLFSGTSERFIQDTYQGLITEKLINEYSNYYGLNPSRQEINSWINSLKAISHTFDEAGLVDHGVILEYQLPLTSKRLDCLICGKDSDEIDNAVIIELKQWGDCTEAAGDNEVITWVGGAKREVLHPSVQVAQYNMYLKETHTSFYEDPQPILLNSCAYLHNYSYSPDDVLLSEKFTDFIKDYPLFTAEEVDEFENYLIDKLENGNGSQVLRRIESGKYKPSKKLMDHVGNVIKGKSEYILLDEQLVVYDKVFSCANDSLKRDNKTVIIVKGGPGTGKSVIAINLMADLSKKHYNTHYSTGSKAFTETLWEIVKKPASFQFKYFNSYMREKRNTLDVLICDESHRIRETSNTWRTKREYRSNIPQIEELINVAKVSVFFIDDHQIVKPGEIGSVYYIKHFAEKMYCDIYEYELETQFRCNGSEAFINWIDSTLGIRETDNLIWDQSESFDFRILESPEELELAIRTKVNKGFTGRLTAGYCWRWSKPKLDGTLVDDVTIGDFKKPWNAKPKSTALAENIPEAPLWAYDPNGINQIGCVYTAQGFEFDYVGVIFGKDLVYNWAEERWEGYRENSADPDVKKSKEQFTELIKNTYRVLLSRGMKGCYVYFMDEDTEAFFKSRIES
jgi:uncharacterized protein